MIGDMQPPSRPKQPQGVAQQQAPPLQPAPAPLSVEPTLRPGLDIKPPKTGKKKKLILAIIGIVILVLLIVAGLCINWYNQSLTAYSGNENNVRFTVASGTSPEAIATNLEKEKLIKNAFAFRLYVKLSGYEDKLQAGTYNLSPSLPVKDIVQHLINGKTDTFRMTFLPGATVAQDKAVFEKAGFSKTEIDQAFSKQYDHPVFATKPASADLEGYIYGETYEFSSTATVEEVLRRTFDELYKVVLADNLVAAYQAQGLSLYQGITLASIIQREVVSPQDQKQVAQIFLLRLRQGISLGSDVTYQYAADKMGVARDPALDSPYNTRVNAGLPPGPISAPGKTALEAVASPASGDYVFFLSGDDDTTYYARTQAEHEKNIADHCQMKCQIL